MKRVMIAETEYSPETEKKQLVDVILDNVRWKDKKARNNVFQSETEIKLKTENIYILNFKMIDEPQLQQPHKFSNGRASKIGFFRGQLGAYRPKTDFFTENTWRNVSYGRHVADAFKKFHFILLPVFSSKNTYFGKMNNVFQYHQN